MKRDIQTYHGKQLAMYTAPKHMRNRIANAAWSPKSKTKAQIDREKTLMNNNRKAKKS